MKAESTHRQAHYSGRNLDDMTPSEMQQEIHAVLLGMKIAVIVGVFGSAIIVAFTIWSLLNP